MPDPVPPPDFLKELAELLRKLGMDVTPGGLGPDGRPFWTWTSPGPQPAAWYWRWWLWIRLRWPWLGRAIIWPIRNPALTILIILIIVAIISAASCAHEVTTKVSTPIPSGASCPSDGADKIYRTALVTAWGCRNSMNQAFAEAEQTCVALKGSCTGGCKAGKMCTTGVVVKDVSQNHSWLECHTFVGFSCDCGCGSAGSP